MAVALLLLAGIGLFFNREPSSLSSAVQDAESGKKNEPVLEGKALEEVAVAHRLFRERDILPENRFLSLERFSIALTCREISSDSLSAWRVDSLMVAAELDSIFESHRKLAIAALNQRNNALCKEHLESVMKVFPSPQNKRYMWAKKNLLSLAP